MAGSAGASTGGRGGAGEEPAAWEVCARVHDGPLQLLMVVEQELDAGGDRAAAVARELVHRAACELRELLAAPPEVVDRAEAQRLLEGWGRTVGRTAGVVCSVRVEADVAELSHVAVDVARELVTNACRHSRCCWVEVRFGRTGGGTTVDVRDDGIGLPPGWQPGYGIRALRTRVAQAGGTVDYRAGRPCGTHVTVRLPDRPPARGGGGAQRTRR